MQQFRDLSELKLNSAALTIGSFDGVHLGHQALLQSLIRAAHAKGLPAVVLTFYPHPSVVLRGRQPALYITSPDEKAELMGTLGVDMVVSQEFSLELSRVTADEFLDRLQDQLGMKALWVGEDFALGYQRQGNRHYLARVAPKRGFEFHVFEPFLVDGEVVSSTRVREALRAGDVERVARYLGRWFRIPGEVVRGAGRGRSLGIPTANLSIWDERAFPGAGVYVCLAHRNQERLPAVVNIGLRPTFEQDRQSPVIEAHLLDFDQDLYGQRLELDFIRRLRGERRFSGPEALLEQIEQDISRARVILDRLEEKGDVRNL
jgi:riboflavin kinase/FMN adenylyltransferase